MHHCSLKLLFFKLELGKSFDMCALNNLPAFLAKSKQQREARGLTVGPTTGPNDSRGHSGTQWKITQKCDKHLNQKFTKCTTGIY